MYTLSDFQFDLPDELVAQHPAEAREQSRLFVLRREPPAFEHAGFHELGSYLRPGDVLVFNDARVIPARLFFRRATGARVEIILASRLDSLRWHALANRTKRLKPGETLVCEGDPGVTVTVRGRAGEYIEVETSREFDDALLERIGAIPLPPYIRRPWRSEDRDRYQTVYARATGAVAAPTAGLHFTTGMLESLRASGVETVFLTLHVSWGTFQPVRTEDLSQHKMHRERYALSAESAGRINAARRDKRRVIAVGTTSLRVLEASLRDGMNEAGEGETDIFIYPPRRALSADGLITNFHTPGSTLLMLVSSFAGYDTVRAAYGEAVRMRYRFFSYGDAMLIL
ncbi:MAG: tRNA preQ1(34) S-adenosylmethionine ribosyltransferase-isomerase QueA [Spirochaetes bacterium]|nr:MAG: tRNA preQ1(34) S-adenosylmethionine ribosyltransferase-isomerase QueA [Spirochaetota bacterium]